MAKTTTFEITLDLPRPILRDFHTFLTVAEKSPIKLTNAKGHINRKTCLAVNAQMYFKAKGSIKSPNQVNFSLIHLFYHLSLYSGLLIVDATRSTKVLRANSDRIAYFRSLSPAAQYVFLIKTLWVLCDWGRLIINDRLAWSFSGMEYILEKLVQKKKVSFSSSTLDAYEFFAGPIPRYFEYFGWWKVTERIFPKDAVSSTAIMVESIELNAFGEAILGQLLPDGRPSLYNIFDYEQPGFDFDFFPEDLLEAIEEDAAPEMVIDITMEEEEEELPMLESLFQPILATPIPEEIDVVPPVVFREGQYTFNVHLHGESVPWRKVVLDAHHTLHDLHLIIQRAFDFDDDHLYCFELGSVSFNVQIEPSYGMGPPPHTEDIKIGLLTLVEGLEFGYVFDYGDWWTFVIKVDQIEEDAPTLMYPRVVGKKGKAPTQYPDWEEE